MTLARYAVSIQPVHAVGVAATLVTGTEAPAADDVRTSSVATFCLLSVCCSCCARCCDLKNHSDIETESGYITAWGD